MISIAIKLYNTLSVVVQRVWTTVNATFFDGSYWTDSSGNNIEFRTRS